MTKLEQKKLAKTLLILYEIIDDALGELSADNPKQASLVSDLQEARRHVLHLWQDFELTGDATASDLGK